MYIRRCGVNEGLEDLKMTRKKVVILTKTMVFLVFSMPPLKIFHGVPSVIVCNSLNSRKFWFCIIKTFSMGNRYELRKNIVTLQPKTRTNENMLQSYNPYLYLGSRKITKSYAY